MMALIKITSWSPRGPQPGEELHASPREQDGQPGWLTWVERYGQRVWVSKDDADELDPPALTAATRASVEAWLERDGRSLRDLADAMWGADWPHRGRGIPRNRGATRIDHAVKRGSLTTSLATDLAHAIGCSVEDLLFHGVDSATAGV